MFTIKHNIFNYEDPWKLGFANRLMQLRANTKRIAYFYHDPNYKPFRYRVYNMMELINKTLQTQYSASFFCSQDIPNLDQIIDNCDLLILGRVMYSHEINYLITKARARNITIIYDIDDLVFDHSYTHLILNTLGQTLDEAAWAHWFGFIARHGSVLKYCDAAIATNSYLAKKIMQYASIPCYIIPNFINQEQLDISHEIMQQKLVNNFARNDNITIGYFSGTPTHNLDFAILNDAIIKLFNDYKQLRLRIVGFLDIKGNLSHYLDRIEFIPFKDYVNLQRYIGEVEINLVPLQINAYTNSKSELKYFEAGICGTVSIASPTTVYCNAIQNNNNGYLANESEWYEKISYVIDNIDNYSAIAKNAYLHSLANYAWYNKVENVRQVISGLC